MGNWVSPASYGLGWLYEHQPGPVQPTDAGKRDEALRRMEASDSPLLREMAASLRQISGPVRGATCAHGIDRSAGCGRCMDEDEQMGAAMSARFEKGA